MTASKGSADRSGGDPTAHWSVARLGELQAAKRHARVRHHFGIQSFGVNGWRGAEAGDRVIDDHDEVIERQEELYVVLAGRALFTIDAEEVDAPVGTLLFVTAEAQRGAVAVEPGTLVLAIGGEPGHPFTPSAWEEWGLLNIQELRDAARYDEAAEQYRSALERHPDHAGVHFNLACLFSLAGMRDDALEHLTRSVELEPRCARDARSDSDLDPIREDPRFSKLVGP